MTLTITDNNSKTQHSFSNKTMFYLYIMTNLIFLISQKIHVVHTYHSERIQAGVPAKNITDVFFDKVDNQQYLEFLKSKEEKR